MFHFEVPNLDATFFKFCFSVFSTTDGSIGNRSPAANTKNLPTYGLSRLSPEFNAHSNEILDDEEKQLIIAR